MYKVWDGTQWNSAKALKVWTGSSWLRNLKFKVRTSTAWQPVSSSDVDDSKIVKWSVDAPTPPPPPPPVTHIVPELDLKTIAEVGSALTPLNFGYTIAGYEVTNVLANDDKVVIDSQIPAAGELLAEGSNVSIKLYNFVQPTTTVPNLNNLLKSAADTAITNANLVVGTPLNTVETYDSNLIGKVVADSQYPASGQTVDTQTSVIYDYYIQKPYTTVPQLVGLPESDIYSVLSDAQLQAGTRTTEETTNQSLEYTIKSQAPAVGTQAQVDSTVNYVVYVPNTKTTVPNIVGKTINEAIALLDNAELNLGSQISTIETYVQAEEGTIYSQTPASGTANVLVDSYVNYVIKVANTKTYVPNIVGYTPIQADALLDVAELNLGAVLDGGVLDETTTESLVGTIRAQSPVANASYTAVNVNSSVSYYLYKAKPKYTVPNIVGLTPSSGAIDSYFTWGSNTLTNTGTTNTALFGTVASQSPAANTQQYPSSINYGVYYDSRITVPNVVGQTQSTAQTTITNAGLNYSVTYQNQTYNGQATAGTVASQNPTSGTKVNAGSTIAIVVWNAYVPQPVTRTATVYVGDNAFTGYMKNGVNYSNTSGALDYTWQAQYKLLNTTGTRVQNITWQRMSSAFVGYWSATNGKQAYTCRINPTTVDSFIKLNITNNASYTVGAVDFVFSVGSDGNNGKLWYLDWMANTTSSPTTYTDANRTNTQAVSNINNGDTMSITLNSTMKSYCWTNGYGLGVAAGVTASNSSVTYGSVNWAYFAAQISWTEYV